MKEPNSLDSFIIFWLKVVYKDLKANANEPFARNCVYSKVAFSFHDVLFVLRSWIDVINVTKITSLRRNDHCTESNEYLIHLISQ